MTPILDSVSSPVFVFEWPADVPLGDLRAHLKEVVELVQAGPVALVHDMRRLGVPPAMVRREAGQVLANHYEAVATNLRGVAHVVDSSLTGGLMTALYWLAPPPFPTLQTRDFDAAVRWAKAQVPTGSCRPSAAS